MRTTRIVYWITTILFTLLILFSGFATLTSQEMKVTYQHLGFNADVFRVEIALAKIIGAILLILPLIKGRLKEWVYAGFTIILISASLAHYGAGDPVANIIVPLLFAIVLLASYFTYRKLNSSALAKA